MFGWLKDKIASSPHVVVVGKGAHKTHNVECRLLSANPVRGEPFGKLSQDRWSDGQGRFKLYLRDLPADLNDKAMLYFRNEQVAEFDVSGGKLEFAWKGTTTDDMPKFEVGEELRVEIGSVSLSGIVKLD